MEWMFVAGVLEMTATDSTIRFSGHTLDKATKAKVTLENYYSNLIAQHLERQQRYGVARHPSLPREPERELTTATSPMHPTNQRTPRE